MLARRTLLAVGAAVALCGSIALAPIANAKPEVGKPAPDFTGIDSKGKSFKLSDLRGKTVVLEWSNHDCPYVRKHYGAGNMQKLQAEAARDGVVWVTVISSASGSEGHVSGPEAEKLSASRKAAPAHIVLDEKGKIGRAYDARTTPHMYVVDAEGKLVYMGGIDDKPTANPGDIATAKNYVRLALDAVKTGRPVATPVARPYGCSIKYAPEDSRS
jgi:peroxiredoxin